MGVAASPIVLNGSHGEGGPALLRTALAMAALTQQPLRIHGIRGNSRRRGLASEDMAFLAGLAESCAAEMSGAELSSSELQFQPTRTPRPLRADLDIGAFETGAIPGNALIVAHGLLPVLARAGGMSSFSVRGETYNPNTLTFDAFTRVTLQAHQQQGIYAEAELRHAGFGFASRGEVHLEVEPSALLPVEWQKRGKALEAGAVIAISKIGEGIAARGASHAASLMAEAGFRIDPDVRQVDAKEPGVFVTLYVRYEGGFGLGTSMGAKGLRMEVVVQRAFDSLASWIESDATVDPYLADQLLIPAALADGKSIFKTSQITRRLITMAWVIKQFLPIHITILGREGEPGTVSVER